MRFRRSSFGRCVSSGDSEFDTLNASLATTLRDGLALQDRSGNDVKASSRAVWQATLGELQVRVSEACYRTWLADTTAVSWSEGVLTIAAPTAFVAEMLERRLFGLVSDSVEKIVGGSVDLCIEVAGSPQAVDGNCITDSASKTEAVQEATRGEGGMRPQGTLNPAYTFDSFVVGGTNELAYTAALAVAERPGVSYNPLFLYSEVGLGKTHLLTAIGHQVRSLGLSAIYTTAEEFTNQYIGAIRGGQTEEFRLRHRGTDVLLIDDVQFLIGKEQTQEGFFHTFNTLHLTGRQIVVTSDRPASALTVLQDRICSRLSGGLTVDIRPPELETRLAILRAKVERSDSRVKILGEALELLAEMAHCNVRELEGALNRAVAYAELTGSEVTPESVRRVVTEALARPKPVQQTQQMVIDAVAGHYAIKRDELTGRRRDARTTLARHVAMYLLREEAHMTLTEIGSALGGRDHSTVLHGRNRVAGLVRKDAAVLRDLTDLRRTLAAR